MNDIKLIKSVVEEILEDLKINNKCRVTTEQSWIHISYITKKGKPINIDTFYCKGTVIGYCDSPIGNVKNIWADLTNPHSIDIIKAIIGLNYDIYVPSRAVAIAKLPLTLMRFFWRVKKPAKEWLGERFERPSGRTAT